MMILPPEDIRERSLRTMEWKYCDMDGNDHWKPGTPDSIKEDDRIVKEWWNNHPWTHSKYLI